MSGFSYKEQYAVIVICKDEKEQEKIYNRLNKEGYRLKVVAV
jgi:predicted 3-demethylubiquinone-9 3-methyltransferase (glyoxalase superfamily)